MIQSSIGNARDFDKVADALVVQHPRVHLREKTRTTAHVPSKGKGRGKGKGKGHKGKGKPYKADGWKNTAHIADADADWEDAAYYAEDDEQPYTDPAHWSDDGGDPDAVAYNAADEEWYDDGSHLQSELEATLENSVEEKEEAIWRISGISSAWTVSGHGTIYGGSATEALSLTSRSSNLNSSPASCFKNSPLKIDFSSEISRKVKLP